MSLQLDMDTVKTGLWCTAALALNQLYIQMMQGKSKFPAGQRPPEDEMLSMAKAQKKKHGVEQTMIGSTPKNDKEKEIEMNVVRWTRIGDNALQNVPMGLIVAWSSMLTASTNPKFSYFFLTFAISRWLHTITYAMKLQPWRAIAWLGGWVGLIGMATLGLLA